MYNDGRDYDVLMEARVVLTFERLPLSAEINLPLSLFSYTYTVHTCCTSDATDVYHHTVMDESSNEYLARFRRKGRCGSGWSESVQSCGSDSLLNLVKKNEM